jgi:hypothetical protein
MAILEGNIAKFTVTFTVTGTTTLIDPTTVQFTEGLNGAWDTPVLYSGASTPSVGVLARLSLGTYQYQVDTTGLAGTLEGDWLSTGVGAAHVADEVQVGGPTAPVYTLGQLTDDTFAQLRGTTRDLVNILAAPIDAPANLTQETISLTSNVDGVTIASLLVIGDETMYVLNVNSTTNEVLVLRGFDDTTPAAQSAGVLVTIDPPWTRGMVQARLRDEIRSWPPQVFQVAAIDVPIVQLQRGYDLGEIPTEIIRILAVTAPQPPYIGSPGYWLTPGDANTSLADPSFSFIYNPNANVSEFPSGKSITLTSPMTPNVTNNLHIVYATPFDVDGSWNDQTDMVGDVGIDSRNLDTPTLGAAARLLRMVSVRRAMLNVEGQSREDQDVTMQAILQAADQFKQDTVMRLGDYQIQLFSDWPIRSSLA